LGQVVYQNWLTLT